MPSYTHPTKWRAYRGHRFCDVNSPYVQHVYLPTVAVNLRDVDSNLQLN